MWGGWEVEFYKFKKDFYLSIISCQDILVYVRYRSFLNISSPKQNIGCFVCICRCLLEQDTYINILKKNKKQFFGVL